MFRKIVVCCAMLFSGMASASSDQVKDLARLCGDDLGKIQDGPLTGAYFGSWDGKLPHLLTVVQVLGTKVKAYYATGVYVPWGLKNGSCGPADGTVVGDQMFFEFEAGKIKVSYRIQGDVLTGAYVMDGYTTPGTFKKVALEPPTSR